jgi:hypothetical protein
VVANHQHGVERLVEALHHPVTPEVVGDEPGARIEIVGEQVAAASVRVDHHEFGGSARGCSSDCRVHVFGHQLAGARILRSRAAGLFGTGHAGDPFHVGTDEDFLAALRGRLRSGETRQQGACEGPA